MASIKLPRPSLFAVLAGVLVSVAVLPLVISHMRLVSINREALRTAEEQYLLRSAVKIAGDVDHFFETSEIQLRKISEALTLAGSIAPDRNPFMFAGNSTLLTEFTSVQSGDVLVLRTLDLDGRGGILQPEKLDEAIDFELARAFKAALDGTRFSGEPVRTPTFPEGGVVKAVPVTGYSKQVLGVVEAFISLASVKASLEDERKRDVTAYIVDRQGNLILSNDPKMEGTKGALLKVELVKEFVAHPVRLSRSYSRMSGGAAKRVLGTVAPIESMDWGVIVEKDEARAYAAVTQMTRTTTIGAIIAMLLGVGAAFLAARLVARPLTELVEKVRLVAEGNYSQKVPIQGTSEIAELSETFNMMSGEIEQAVIKLKQAARENQELFLNSIRSLAAAIDAKDPYTRGHSERVARYSVIIAKEMSLPPEEIRKVRIAALLHDVGKIGIDDRILRKPTALTDDEFDVMKTHPVKGSLIMGHIPQLREIIPGMKHHHERWDGGGYPDGLMGEEIPFIARIVSVADTFDAMTTTRPYQKAMKTDFVVSRIRSFTGTRFDPAVVSALVKSYEKKELEVVGEAARLAASA
ncbi:MAG: HD domain-containing protein [Acidobacteria bacterium]|nr:HD domain-containing protein [Acidobacteriota bacterium]MCG3195466.1 hypothetical protein [Thermoanaerobaculia bacterium]